MESSIFRGLYLGPIKSDFIDFGVIRLSSMSSFEGVIICIFEFFTQKCAYSPLWFFDFRGPISRFTGISVNREWYHSTQLAETNRMVCDLYRNFASGILYYILLLFCSTRLAWSLLLWTYLGGYDYRNVFIMLYGLLQNNWISMK